MPSLVIDGESVEASARLDGLGAASRLGDPLRAVCHDPRIRPAGGCVSCRACADSCPTGALRGAGTHHAETW